MPATHFYETGSKHMTNLNLALLHNAREVRKQIKASARWSHASIRDAVELAADNLRLLDHEQQEMAA